MRRYILLIIFAMLFFPCAINAKKESINYNYHPKNSYNFVETNVDSNNKIEVTKFLGDSIMIGDGETRIDYDSLCSENNVKKAMKIVGYVVAVIRWIVPLLIIIFGMLDFGKAAISNDDKATSKAAQALLRRFIAGVVVFFIPTIVMAFLSYLEVTNGIENQDNSNFGTCTKCIFDPFDSCDTY